MNIAENGLILTLISFRIFVFRLQYKLLMDWAFFFWYHVRHWENYQSSWQSESVISQAFAILCIIHIRKCVCSKKTDSTLLFVSFALKSISRRNVFLQLNFEFNTLSFINSWLLFCISSISYIIFLFLLSISLWIHSWLSLIISISLSLSISLGMSLPLIYSYISC